MKKDAVWPIVEKHLRAAAKEIAAAGGTHSQFREALEGRASNQTFLASLLGSVFGPNPKQSKKKS